MVLELTNKLGLGGGRKSGRPFLNEIFTNMSRFRGKQSFRFNSYLREKRRFWSWFRENIELSSPAHARVNDTIQSVEFFKPDGGTLGRNKRLEAEKLFYEGFVTERMKSMWFDAIVTGSGFLWMGFLKDKQIKSIVERMVKLKCPKFNINTREAKNALHDVMLCRAIDEDSRIPRTIDYVASSMVEILYNDTNVIGYRQHNNAKFIDFGLKEIIHIPFMSVDGKVDGHTPIEALTKEMIMLWLLKTDLLSRLENSGRADKMFVLPEEHANSDNHEYMLTRLEEDGFIQNRHGNLVVTGKLDVVDLDIPMNQMDHKELALYITSNIAYGLQIPVSRIPYMIGQSQSSGDAGGLGESGYWSMIEADQIKIETFMNTQLWGRMGVHMRFKKHYKVDSVRETQALDQLSSVITKVQSTFSQYDKRLKPDKIASLMNLRSEDLEAAPKLLADDIELPEKAPGNGDEVKLQDKEVLVEEDKNNKNEVLRKASNNNPKMNDQSGY